MHNQTNCSWFLFVHVTTNRNSIKWKLLINQFMCSSHIHLPYQAAVLRERKLVPSAQLCLSSFCHYRTALVDNVQCDGDQPPTFIHLTLSQLCFICSLRRKQTSKGEHFRTPISIKNAPTKWNSVSLDAINDSFCKCYKDETILPWSKMKRFSS